MAQPPAPVSMSQALATAPSDSSSYKKNTKNDLKVDHDLFKQLETCDSPAAILAVFQAAQFDPSRTAGDDRLKTWFVPIINVLYAFSGTLSKGVALVLSPAKIFFAGIGVLLRSYEAIDVAASQDILVDIFGRIEGFFVWLEIYTELVKVTHNIDNNVSGIDDGVRGVDVKVQVVNSNFKAVSDRVQTIAEDGKATATEVNQASDKQGTTWTL
ncbi:hypothetical protein EDB83DRAFT_2518324 [Lactarius deliciosus]|nr:hypothetical protein EDB83DRAFT_2518324 [Lactarius deliciosus]